MRENKIEDSAMGARHVQALLATSAIIIAYLLRVHISFAIVVMTDTTKANLQFPVYHWNEVEKSRILSSFFWGYVLSPVLMGKLAERVGPKIIVATAMTLASALNIAITFCAPYGYFPILILRILQGVTQGSFIPCITLLLSRWFSPVERSRALAIAISGNNIGTVITFPMCGYLASSNFGWPSIFNVTGCIGLIWVFLWLSLGASRPNSRPRILESEELHTEAPVGNDEQSTKKLKTPWKEIIRSKPVWAVLITHAGDNWGYWLLLTQLPNYMNSVLGVDIRKNGILSALPYLSAWFGAIFYSWMAVLINTHCSVSKTVVRKCFNTLGTWGSGLGLLTLALWDTRNVNVAISILIATTFLNSAIFAGFMTNHMDLSPNFCGTLIGITNSFANTASMIAPLSVGWMVTDVHSSAEWKNVFLLASGILFCTNLVYLMFGSSEVQCWNCPQSSPIIEHHSVDNEEPSNA